MSIRNLEHLFAPRSVAVIGASDRPHSVGATVLLNLLNGGFIGTIYPVNPKHDVLFGHTSYASVAALPAVPDLAIICTPAATVPDIVAELGLAGTRAAIVLTAGMNAIDEVSGLSLHQAALDAAKPHLLRLLGPNCVGLLVPGIGLNASFAHTDALPGKIAFVSQSGALVTGILDWAKTRGIGFSKFISLGDSADIDFGDVLDYLALDSGTSAILIYMEDVRLARKFMSAARAAARTKPTLILKAGRAPEGARAASSHTGALAGSDAVYDAAIRRAGMLRVFSTEDLFSAVETLARAHRLGGERLAILTNGGGTGVMATDELVCSHGTLATLAPATLARLNEVLPPHWSHANPVDIIGDAPASRYADALKVLLQDEGSDAILLIHAPTAIVPSLEIANVLLPLLRESSRNVLACWLGGEAVAQARGIFSNAGIPTFDTPEEAVQAFLQIVHYQRNRDLLMQVPPSTPIGFIPDRTAALLVTGAALAAGREMLSEPEAKQVLAAYGIPVVETRIAANIEEAVHGAEAIGFPVAVKILSPDINHKSDVGGVALDLETPHAVFAAARGMHARLTAFQPEARLHGFSVQAMARRPQSSELIIGMTTDPVFGPVILFGQGGVAVEVMDDHALALPPLNMVLARDMVSRTRVSKLLAGYRNIPPADLDAICRTLVQVAQLVIDIPEITELDINPLLADGAGVIALDARMRLTRPQAGTDPLARLVIRPYPQELEESLEWDGRAMTVRPIRPQDGPAHEEFFNALAPEDLHFPLFLRVHEMQPSQLARFTQIDYDREMAFIATALTPGGKAETLGVARVVVDPDNVKATCTVVVRSDLKRRGLGQLLMNKLIVYCQKRGTGEIVGETLSQNVPVINLARQFGFKVERRDNDQTIQLRLVLEAP
jgi:acetyltransferase